MKKIVYLTLCVFLFASCQTQKTFSDEDYQKATATFMKSITANELEDLLYVYAGDEMAGREAGTEGEGKANIFLKNYYEKLNVAAAPGTNQYYQLIPEGTFSRLKDVASNIIAYIPGSEKPEEVLVISAHLDHLGEKNGEIFNGADDDGSGTVAVLAIANAFQKAVKAGYQPKRTIVFLHVTAEEKGLLGSKYYSENPLFPLSNTIANLNIDMIGRIDEAHTENENYVYVIGSNMLSTDLYNISESTNGQYVNLELDYKYDDPKDPNRFYYRSDHYNFAKHNIPVIFYFNGTHEDYHKSTDTPDKINYPLLAKRTQLIFATAWALANGDERPVVDKTP